LPSPDPAAEAAFQAEVRRNLRRNYLSHLCHGLLGQTGMRLVNAPTFVPVYIASVAGFDAAVGIARGLQYFGMFLSPIIGATVIEHRRRVLPVGLVVGALMRVQILGLALGGLWLPPPWPLVSAWLFLGLFGVFLGVQGVIFNFLVAKVVPVEKRGVLLGLRNALAGATAATVAFLAGRYLIEPEALGNGYAATFLLAFGLTSLGLLASRRRLTCARPRGSGSAFGSFRRCCARIAASRATSSPARWLSPGAWASPSTCCTPASGSRSTEAGSARSPRPSWWGRASGTCCGDSLPIGAASGSSSWPR
jgi:hypothetical protein